MVGKFKKALYGYCPRTKCERQEMLPIGETNVPGLRCVKLYCPRCQEVYQPINRFFENIDGSFFGTSFPHLFLMEYPELRPLTKKIPFRGSICGFKIHESSLSRPPKVIYNPILAHYENIQRPQANFCYDERKIKEKLEKRGSLTFSKMNNSATMSEEKMKL